LSSNAGTDQLGGDNIIIRIWAEKLDPDSYMQTISLCR